MIYWLWILKTDFIQKLDTFWILTKFQLHLCCFSMGWKISKISKVDDPLYLSNPNWYITQFLEITMLSKIICLKRLSGPSAIFIIHLKKKPKKFWGITNIKYFTIWQEKNVLDMTSKRSSTVIHSNEGEKRGSQINFS